MPELNGITYCEDCLATVGVTGECLCLVESVESNWHNDLLASEGWFASGEELEEEETWMAEAEDIPMSAEETVQKIRLALRETGGGVCGRGDRSGGCSGCTCGKR